MDPSPTAPPVVAVVVTCDPGPWFEETLQALAGQDYPNMSLLFVDSASAEDPTSRVAAVIPDAFVLRLKERVGFGRAANEVLDVVDGASHFLFCHDDVAPAPDAFRLMVEEAYRSNAGVVTPKVVEWDRPDRLISVGVAADRVGVLQPMIERGELDQEQHDRVREVFVAPGGVTLVRADLFSTLQGYSRDITELGEDLDLSWRAQLAGARVVTSPAARVRHLEASAQGARMGVSRSPVAVRRANKKAETHRLRTLMTCVGAARLPLVLALAVVENLLEALGELLIGRPGDAAVSVSSLGAALHHPARLAQMRHLAQSPRRVGDLRITRRQFHGSARLRAFVRARMSDDPSGALPLEEVASPEALVRRRADRADRDRDRAERDRAERADGDRAGVPAGMAAPRSMSRGAGGATALLAATAATAPHAVIHVGGDGNGAHGTNGGQNGGSAGKGEEGIDAERVTVGRRGWRSPLVVGGLIVVFLIVGSRSLLGGDLPPIGRIPVTTGGLGGWWRAWWSTWQPGMLGAPGASPPGLGLLAIAGTIFFGAVGVAQRVLVLLPLLLGPFGAYRAARWWGSTRGRVAAMIVYAFVPVPYNALAHGNWPGLLAYAAAPWALSMIARLSTVLPFPPTTPRAVAGRAAGVGVLVAVVAAFAPSWILVVPAMGLALSLGTLLSGRANAAWRSFATSLLAAVVAFVLLLPWSLHTLGSRVATFGVPLGRSDAFGLGQVLQLHTGPVGSHPLGWALVAAAALPLLIGRSWRLAWAARLWMVALVAVGLVWAGSHGWIPTPPPEDVLCFAAAAWAGCVALGAVAFELDLPGYRLGWRQLASGLAAVAVVVAALPTFGAAGNGRWHLPTSGANAVLGFLPSPAKGDYRVLWLGPPDSLPLSSEFLASGVGYATSFDGEPAEADQWAPPRTAGGEVMGVDIRRSLLGLTTQLGHLLAPYGVRYIVVPAREHPWGGSRQSLAAGSIVGGLTGQVDLVNVSDDLGYSVYLNSAWAPARSVASRSLSKVIAAPEAAQSKLLGGADLAGGSTPVLTGSDPARVSGRVPGGSTVTVSATRSGLWGLVVGGRRVAPRAAYGWAMRFAVPAGSGGRATLAAGTAVVARVVQLVVLGLWVALIALLQLDRRRRLSGAPEVVRPEWFAPLSTGRRRRRERTGSRSGLATGDDDLASDELWIDA